MNRSVRVSRKAVMDVLKDKLSLALAYDIYVEICKIDDNDADSIIGMTVYEFRERFDNDYRLVWYEDTGAGFGKAGDSVYGNSDDLVIIMTSEQGGVTNVPRLTLHVWSPALHSDNKAIKSVMMLRAARNRKEVTA